MGYFLLVLDDYTFNDLKWTGCKYLLSRTNDAVSFYDHEYFVYNFFTDSVDTSLYPLLMPIFDLDQDHFKEIFVKLINLEEYDFSEIQSLDKSLLCHCLSSSASYLELLHDYISLFYFESSGQKLHVFENTSIPVSQRILLVEKFKNPIDLLYLFELPENMRLLSENIHHVDINKTLKTTLNQIFRSLVLPNSLVFLKSVTTWKPIHLAIIFQNVELSLLILKDSRFDRTQLNNRISDRITVFELVDCLINFQNQSPYHYYSAIELEKVAEFLKTLKNIKSINI